MFVRGDFEHNAFTVLFESNQGLLDPSLQLESVHIQN